MNCRGQAPPRVEEGGRPSLCGTGGNAGSEGGGDGGDGGEDGGEGDCEVKQILKPPLT